MFEELQGKKVGVFGVCAEPQQLVDQAVKEWGLRFTVRERRWRGGEAGRVCASLVDQAMKESEGWDGGSEEGTGPERCPSLFLQCFSDPTHILRNYLDEKGLISIRISGGENSTDSGFYKVHPKIKNYKHGVAQPGVLCVKPDGSKIYTWAIDPSFVS